MPDMADFALEEYRALRAEALERSRQDSSAQRNAILVGGGLIAYVFTNEINISNVIVLAIVPCVFLVALLQVARHKTYGRRIGAYNKRLEAHSYKDWAEKGEVFGWEHFLETEREDESNEAPTGIFSYLRHVLFEGKNDGSSVSLTVVETRYLVACVLATAAFALLYFIFALFFPNP